MIKIFTKPCHLERKRNLKLRTGAGALLFFIAALPFGVSAQTVSWNDNFVQGASPSSDQCLNWNNFLNGLSNKSFASVTLSGTFDRVGKSINNAALATELARLLSTRTSGSVQNGNEYWTVTAVCGTAVTGCGEYLSTTLSVSSNDESCGCTTNYAIRAGESGSSWGGVATSTCGGPSQSMSLVFNPAVTIEGSNTFCQGESTELTAHAAMCSGPYTYLWSNNATTPSIIISEPGSYSVTVTSMEGCVATSASFAVGVSEISVDAGDDVTICSEPVQLTASGVAGGGGSATVNKYCTYDAPGGLGNCFFTTNLCSNGDGSEQFLNTTFTQSLSGSRPNELRVLLYYSANDITTFTFSLNGHELGSFIENNPTGNCETGGVGQYPRTFTFALDQCGNCWNTAGANIVSVGVATAQPIFMAGVVIETENSNQLYSWSPAAGLSDPAVKNPMANPTENTTYTVTFTDANGCSATDQVLVKVDCNPAPVAVCKAVAVEADANCEALVQAADFDGGSSSPSNLPLHFTISPAGPYAVGETAITLTVTDSNGKTSTCNTTLTVRDATLPSITAPPDITIHNDPGVCSAKLDLHQPEASDNCGVSSISNDRADDIFPVGETIVTWKVTDLHGNEKTAVQKITVTNDQPVISSVTASPSTVKANENVTLTVAYEDNNVKSASVNWGDLSAAELLAHPENSFHLSHTYARAGTYSVAVIVTDECDASASYVYESILVVEEHAGSVKGDGWYYSKPGYYLKDRRAAGKAQFEFSASYKKGSATLTGKLNFRFKDGDLAFKSSGLDRLDVAGQDAFLTGSGKMNGKKGYEILIGMYDDDAEVDHDMAGNWKEDKGDKKKDDDHHGNGHHKADRIRVKIWDPHGAVIYDTQAGSPDDAFASTDLGGGSIRILQSTFGEMPDDGIASYFEEDGTSVYPNPFDDWLSVQFISESNENVNVQLLDLTGKVIFNKTYRVADDGSYTLDLPEGKRGGGLYILRISQGRKVEFVRVLRK